MLLPSVFNDNVFDDLMNDFDDVFTARNPLYGKHSRNMMKTDVRDVGDHYELDIDLPGFKKDEIHAQLENGYLTISASKGVDKDEKDKNNGYRLRHCEGEIALDFQPFRKAERFCSGHGVGAPHLPEHRGEIGRKDFRRVRSRSGEHFRDDPSLPPVCVGSGW